MIGHIFPQVFASFSQQRLSAQGVPVFIYHSIGKPAAGSGDPYLYVSPERFDEQLGELQAAGFSSGSLADIGKQPGNPKRHCVITFDDGCRNVFEHAQEILARRNFRAVQFLVAGLIGGRSEWTVRNGRPAMPLADAAQIREWLAAGHSIGSHTSTHPVLTQIDPAAAREEIVSSRKRLEDAFACAVTHFAYPGGRWNSRVRDMVAEAGYATACTTAFGVNTSETPGHELRRIFPLSLREFAGKIVHRIRRKFLPK